MKILTLTAVASAGLLAAAAGAQPTMPWFTIDAGGGTSAGGSFTLSGTIGQCDAAAPMTGGGFTLTGGFWAGMGGCATDWNGDGQVNSSDISSFLTSWLQSVQDGTLAADFNNDGGVNSTDISAFLTAWLTGVQGGC